MRLGKSLIIITILIWLFIIVITLFTRIDIKYVDSFTPQEEEYLYNNFFNGKNEKIRLCLFSHNSDQTGRGGGTKLISMVKKEDYEVLNNVINYKICTKKEKGEFYIITHHIEGIDPTFYKNIMKRSKSRMDIMIFGNAKYVYGIGIPLALVIVLFGIYLIKPKIKFINKEGF